MTWWRGKRKNNQDGFFLHAGLGRMRLSAGDDPELSSQDGN